MKLEPRDCRLLAQLQLDSRISNADLADRVGMSPSACWRRIRQLEDAGLITGYRAEVRADRAGLAFEALVHVNLTRHNETHLEEFISAIARRPEVMDCYATTGKSDYHLRVVCGSIAAYTEFLEEFLFRLPAVASAETNVVLRQIKRSAVLPIAPIG
ncbi:Lrp/AsnC family transcriptional regulator [Sulfitobacter albidus]|uniref:Lrp/AsnC family transcriptional regulator n=1 Tax=Sulfitobacter albidus TaxID=2829501 RepID=A0A975JCT7_9RHOB|nr:Lrp/AsnC family transcriptional regulator [Sulfitobacter albidus]QUJ76124.1 Lrp/AsnC family transcriptional regulator [Sulfitobacter albidus]